MSRDHLEQSLVCLEVSVAAGKGVTCWTSRDQNVLCRGKCLLFSDDLSFMLGLWLPGNPSLKPHLRDVGRKQSH